MNYSVIFTGISFSPETWEVGTNKKFQDNISKIIPARPKNTGTYGVNTIRVNVLLYSEQCFNFKAAQAALYT